MLVIEDDHIAFALAEAVSRDYISDYMNCDFEVVSKAMKLMFVIIKAADSTLHRFLTEGGVEPFFATSWLLTWFAHDLPLIADAARVYDAILCSHPLFCYYLCAAVSFSATALSPSVHFTELPSIISVASISPMS